MLAIVGGKGGCGKTTTALGVARALAADGHRPVVADTDCAMPNLHAMAGTDLRPGLGAVAEGTPVEGVVHRSRAYPGVDVVPAGTATGPPSETTLGRLSRAAGLVVLDCPAGATEGVTAPVCAADDALVVTTAERASLVDAAKTARIVETLGTRLAGAVVTRTRDGLPGCRRLDALRETCPVLGTVPETDDVLSSRAGRAAYERVACRLSERNI
jgi:septum site-determining protein MinD